MRKELKTTRDPISNYTTDKEKSLQDLVDAGYMRRIPTDPFTGSTTTWQVEISESLRPLDQKKPGVRDVHSGSNRTGSNGAAYSSW